MLQRFRQNKDFRAPDRYKSKNVNFEEVKEKEGEWYRENAQTVQQKEKEKKDKTEKGRYLQALKVLVKENGRKMNPEHGDIPALCNCGAQQENMKSTNADLQMCASNCQFYKNEKGYVRALRDVLHSIN